MVETVTWPDMGGTQPVTEITNLAPPVGVYDPASGSIAVKVFDSTGAVSDNINVQITGPVTQSQQTTTEGCAYFTFIPAGTYTVSVIEGTGVGDQEVVAPAQTASVSVGQTVSLQFLYDTPATIVATLPSPTNTPGAPAHATGHGDRGREHRPPAVLPVHVRGRSRRRHDLARALPVRERLHRVRGQLHRQQPAG